MSHGPSADNPQTRGIADFVTSLTYEQIPAEVIARIKLLILDSLGCAMFGTGLPSGLRVFLLALAILDDIVGIIFIAVLFADDVDVALLAAALLTVVVFGALSRQLEARFVQHILQSGVLQLPVPSVGRGQIDRPSAVDTADVERHLAAVRLARQRQHLLSLAEAHLQPGRCIG